ncbi:hypothetical protein RN001_014932 [Aquatica leii]|uniref:Uncharacterized protein n=1 Tax=Aquatica leii TaxID=1421715 RepID=A0AAN7P153_9COLE|nr:hypothetical protein RN001_014932 [Aquatica leii]
MTIETESQTDAWKAHRKETKEIAIQTTQGTVEEKEMINSVENVNTYEEWKQVAEEEWGDSAYIHTKIVEGHPLQETTATSTLWVTEKEVEENTGLQLMIEKVYPEINKGKEEMETMERKTKTKTKNNTNIKKIKIIRIIYQDHEEDVWKKLETIKSETEEDEKIMLHKLKTMSVNRLRKMAECIFKTKKTRINIIVPKDTQTQQSIAKQDNQKKTYALAIEQKGKKYEELVTRMRTQLIDKEETEKIQTIRSTKEGKLLITIDKDEKALNRIKEELEKGNEEVNEITKLKKDHSGAGDEYTWNK